MREALVDVLVDDVRLVQDEVALDQHRGAVVRIHHREVLGLVIEIDVDDLEIHSFLVQHDAASLTERIGRAGIEGHHFGSPDIAKGIAARDAGSAHIPGSQGAGASLLAGPLNR
jgi:hypothetical protein